MVTTAALGFSAGQAAAMPDQAPVASDPVVSIAPTDLRSPDAVDAARPPVQDLRSPDAVDAGQPVQIAPPVAVSEPSSSSWDEIGIIGGSFLALVLVGMAGMTALSRHRATARAAALH